jgi:IS605 OrfB family transposase
MSYPKLDKFLRENRPKLYYRLSSQVTQNVLREIDSGRKSFFALLKLALSGKYKEKVRPPKYIKDKGLHNLHFGTRTFRIKGSNLLLSVSKYHRNRHDIRSIEFPLPSHLKDSDLREVEIKPTGYGSFELHIKYEEREESEADLKADEYLSIDLGLNNLVSAASTLGDAFLISGRKIKSVNQWYNKNISFLRSAFDKEKNKLNRMKLKQQISRTTAKRNRTVKDILHKVSHKVVEYCIKNQIGNIVIGQNKGWKRSIDIGRRNNQKFVQIPHAKLIHYIQYKASALGIVVKENEESYTSKCDSLALEPIQKQTKYLGRRIKRGLFRSSLGVVINADINGAINILRKALSLKSKNESSLIEKIVSSGRVFRPWHVAVT